MSNDTSYLIIVDDTDPSIVYSGGWNATETGESLPDGGRAYNSTETYTLSDNSSFKFKFNGTSVSWYGMIDTTDHSNLPDWDCQVDGKAATKTQRTNDLWARHWTYCSADNLSESEHELEVQVKSKQYISLDGIKYQSLKGNDTDGDTVVLDVLANGDGIKLNGDGWTDYDFGGKGSRGVKMSKTPGSYITVDFEGTGINLVSSALCCATNDFYYVIDGSAPIHIQPIYIGKDTPDLENQPLLYESNLDGSQQHRLTLSHNGTTDGAPLLVTAGYITRTGAASLSGVSATPSPSSSDHSGTKNQTNVGAIVGGVFGGVASLVIGLLCLWYCCKRNKKPSYAAVAGNENYPFLMNEGKIVNTPQSTLSAGYPANTAYNPATPPANLSRPGSFVNTPPSSGGFPPYSDSSYPGQPYPPPQASGRMSYPPSANSPPLYDPHTPNSAPYH